MENNFCFFCKSPYSFNYLRHIDDDNIKHNQNVRDYYKELIESNYSKNNKLDNKK